MQAITTIQASAILPATLITDPDFIYTPSNKTDVARTFRRHGWVEPDRARQRDMKRRLNPTEDLALETC